MHHATMLGLLTADEPHPTHSHQLMLFGQFVGSWDLDMVAYQPDGTARRFTGEWHFGWVLEGRAIQDVLIARPTGDRVTAGTTRVLGRSVSPAASPLHVHGELADGGLVVLLGVGEGEPRVDLQG